MPNLSRRLLPLALLTVAATALSAGTRDSTKAMHQRTASRANASRTPTPINHRGVNQLLVQVGSNPKIANSVISIANVRKFDSVIETQLNRVFTRDRRQQFDPFSGFQVGQLEPNLKSLKRLRGRQSLDVDP